ncbi:MAG: aminopeptidase [Deltaproteobacteria bacterium]|nr:aminopeptidase [Deltaproteobacteria bacterium]
MTSYLLEQASGQLHLLRHRERIETLLRREDLSKTKRWKLRLVLLTREHASEVIGLRRSGAYTTFYETGGQPIAYNVSAALKVGLRPKLWRFPIVGALPYLGFFSKKRAEEARLRLQRQGLDTYLRPVSAYSSLGFFDDPVYSPMLRSSPDRLAELVIHESTHTTIFLRGRVGFNESLAVFVGQQGTLDLFTRLFGAKSRFHARAKARFTRSRTFGRLINQLRKRLLALYASPISREQKLRARSAIFVAAQARYRSLFPDSRHWGRFVSQRLNNAIVLSYGRYLEGVEFHQAVYRCLGRDLRAMVALYRYAQNFSHPIRYVAKRCHLQTSPRN